MAGNPFTQLVFDLFIISAILITAYTCNFYYLVLLANKRNKSTKTVDLGTPSVTIQLPIYNEKYVAKRLVDAVCDLDYPKNQMNIMVLDDSDDDTVDLLEKTVNYYKTQGFQIEHIRRGTRKGYKAGALKYAMQITDTELVAIFDADFISFKSEKSVSSVCLPFTKTTLSFLTKSLYLEKTLLNASISACPPRQSNLKKAI